MKNEQVRLVRALPKDFSARHIGSQLVRSSTSSGANYEEARAAESRDDFIHKVGIAAKEIRETVYWLRLVQRSSMTTMRLDGLIERAKEMMAILGASNRTARRNAGKEDISGFRSPVSGLLFLPISGKRSKASSP